MFNVARVFLLSVQFDVTPEFFCDKPKLPSQGTILNLPYVVNPFDYALWENQRKIGEVDYSCYGGEG